MNNEKQVDPINDFRDAKVGDLVTCLSSGKGFIKKIESYKDCPILVFFEGIKDVDSYSIEGRTYCNSVNPSLYKGHVDFKIEVIKPRVKKYFVAFHNKEFMRPSVSSLKYQNVDEYLRSAEKSINDMYWIQLIEASMELCDE